MIPLPEKRRYLRHMAPMCVLVFLIVSALLWVEAKDSRIEAVQVPQCESCTKGEPEYSANESARVFVDYVPGKEDWTWE